MTAPSLVRTAPQPAEWRKIHDGMRSLWRACLPEEAGFDVARSLTINFVAVADDPAALRDATERLPTRMPCRAFLLQIDETAEPGGAELAATTRCHGSVRDIVLEEIWLRVPPHAIGQVPGIVRPLLMSDLPNHLFWARPFQGGDAVFDALAKLCDHVVVDSRRFTDAPASLKAVQQRRSGGMRVTDLNWLRLRPWRRALAEAFERVAWQPGSTTDGSIRHGKAAAASARLLADWLEQRLGARPRLDATGDAAAITPEAVELRTGVFEVDLQAARHQIRVHVATPEHCHLPFSVPLARGTDGDLLATAIETS